MKYYIRADHVNIEDDVGSRLELAEDRQTSPRTLRVLANDPSHNVRLETAYNPNTPADALELLAQSDDVYIQRAVAENLNTPESVLRDLAENHVQYNSFEYPFPFVVLGIAANPNASEDLLRELIEKYGSRWHDELAEALVHNPNAPKDIDIRAPERMQRVEVGYDRQTDLDGESVIPIIERIFDELGYRVYESRDYRWDEFSDNDQEYVLIFMVEPIASFRNSRLLEHKIRSVMDHFGFRNVWYNDDE